MSKSNSSKAKVKNGFYRTSYGGNPQIIFVFSSEYAEQKSPMGSLLWKGVVYKYFDFSDEKIYHFNEYWEDYIQSLIPLKMTPKEISTIQSKISNEISGKSESLNELSQLQEVLSKNN